MRTSFAALTNLVYLATTSAALSLKPPSELYSPLIPQKILATAKSLPDPIQYPQYTDQSGTWKLFAPDLPSDIWTSGFFPATLYELHTRTKLCPPNTANGLGAADWLELGRQLSTGEIQLEGGNVEGHDQGFLSYPFMAELAVNPHNETARTAVKAFGNMLAERYSPIVKCTRSWDNRTDPTDFLVIIDNMMNLELLFSITDVTGNQTYRDIAIAHADTTMANHIRPDGGTWHVVEYNSTTGNVIKKRTYQGYSDDSTWSRGQAWGIYGFSNLYRHTKKTSYLKTARRLAAYFLSHMPSDGIVPWDFNAPLTPAPRPADSSAATIAATGLLLLSELETSPVNKVTYRNSAIGLLNNMTTLAWDPSWQSLLSNGTVNWPVGNMLTGTVYGDYYYLKAGNALLSQGLARCT